MELVYRRRLRIKSCRGGWRKGPGSPGVVRKEEKGARQAELGVRNRSWCKQKLEDMREAEERVIWILGLHL